MSTATPINNSSMALSAAAKALPLRIRRTAAATIATSTHNNDDFSQTKNVVVLGGSYGGMHAATLLAQKLPPTHRVILIDQNSHFNHLYVFPRFSVLPGHEQKAFIPYTSIFSQSPDRTKKQSSSSSAERNDAPSIIRATTATAPTFDLEMGSTASATRELPATAAAAMKSTASPTTPSSTAPSSSSSSTSSFSLSSPIEDDYSSSSSSSDENHHPSTNSSLLFDRQAGGPHSTRSVASTLSSLYTASSDSRGTASTDSGEEEGLVRKLESNLHLAEVVQEQEAEPIQTRSVNGAKVEFGTEAGDTLRVVDEVTPAEAVHEQEALGRQPMRVETEGAAQSEPEKEEEVEAEAEGNTYEGAPPHVFLQATVTDIKPDHVLVEVCPPRDTSSTQGTHTSNSSSATSSKPLWNITSRSLRIPYTHLIYALGSHLPDPLRTEARTKGEGMNWMREIQDRVRDAEDIVLVGGGALGVQFASDIASVHGTVSSAPHPSCASQASAQQEVTNKKKKKKKRVTLIHSRQRLLPNFDERIHEIALKRLTELGVDVVLGERLALTDGCPRGSATVEDRVKLPRASIDGSSSSSASTSWTVDQETTTKKEGNQLLDVRNASAAEVSNAASRPGRKLVRTTAGKLFHADVLLLCTGQQPNSSLLGKLSPSSVDPRTRLVKVRRTLQVERLPGTENWGGVMEAKAPCGDCDCFIDRKMDAPHEHLSSSNCDCGLLKQNEDAEEEVEDRSRCLGNVYAIGDCADAFGALNAGYQAWAMADVAAENVLRDLGVVGEQGKGMGMGTGPKLLKRFKPVPPMLKLSLGLGTMAWQGAPVPHRVQPRRRRSVTSSQEGQQQTRTRSGTVSEGSITPTLSSIPVEDEEEEEDGDEGEMVMKPEVMEKEDPFDLGVEGVWKYMANADTEDLYL
ncbi:hypothetical protein CF326_g2649 [Tilletia indica]|nr:hypothetical protein CF326_g2649 [Tilletia indica]